MCAWIVCMKAIVTRFRILRISNAARREPLEAPPELTETEMTSSLFAFGVERGAVRSYWMSVGAVTQGHELPNIIIQLSKAAEKTHRVTWRHTHIHLQISISQKPQAMKPGYAHDSRPPPPGISPIPAMTALGRFEMAEKVSNGRFFIELCCVS